MKFPPVNARRRRILALCSLGAVAGAAIPSAWAMQPLASAKDLPRVDESGQVANSLGYKHDAARVDRKKFPQYQGGQKCSNCQLFRGKPGEQWGPCTVFSGKLVNANGWCSAYTRKG